MFASLFGSASSASRIDGPRARALVAGCAQLVDVRSPGEFAGGALPGARNIPVHELDRRLAELSKDRELVVYCASGGRSASAASLLARAGFTKVHDLGGIGRW